MAEATSDQSASRATISRRLAIVAVLFAIWAMVILGRLFYLQVIAHDHLQRRADDQQVKPVEVPPKRGDIVDRRGTLLAFSVDVDAVGANPALIEDRRATAAAVCAAIDDCSAAERDELVSRLGGSLRFVYLRQGVRRQVSPASARRIQDLELPGIEIRKENRRYYPSRERAAHVLGFVLFDNRGGAGIEAAYDRRIRGRAGTAQIQVDGARQPFGRPTSVPPTAGATVELTLDATLQYFAEEELGRGVAESQAESGVAIIMDPRSGEILALANVPTYNPNRFWESSANERRNRAVQDLYEPGSTFKLVSGSAALEEGIVMPDDPVDVSDGYLRIGARRIDDVHRYGVLSFRDVIVKSSNVGAAKVGLRTGAERLTRYIRRFGFGTRLSPDFPGENSGLVWDPADLNDSAVASISMGYQIGVTPLQMAAAVSSIANGGELIRPRVVRALIADGRRVEVTPERLRRTIEPATAAVLTAIMEDVVEHGTGTSARIEGYSVAGKTGTAQRLIDGEYSKTEYNASFVGFLPARAPAIAVVVLVSSPHAKGYYGGTVAAPIFKRIAERAIRYLGIPPDVDPPAAVLAARAPDAGPHAGTQPLLIGTRERESVARDPDAIPDLTGLSARVALNVVTRLGLTATLDGDGEVIGQEPPPGTRLPQGGRCVLRLGRPDMRDRGGSSR